MAKTPAQKAKEDLDAREAAKSSDKDAQTRHNEVIAKLNEILAALQP